MRELIQRFENKNGAGLPRHWVAVQSEQAAECLIRDELEATCPSRVAGNPNRQQSGRS
jgi:hypothetical protein